MPTVDPTGYMGYAAHLGCGSAIPVTECYEFQGLNFGRRTTVQELNGIRGTRQRFDERARMTSIALSGGFKFNPTPAELRNWLPRILGGTEAGSGPYTYALAETLPSFYMTIDRVARQWNCTGCKVDQATIQAGQGGILELQLTIEGLSDDGGSATTFPLITPVPDAPWAFKEGVLTLGGSSQPFYMNDFRLHINNHLKKDNFKNSVWRINLLEADLEVTMEAKVHYASDTYSLLFDNADINTSVNGTVTFTRGGNILLLTLTDLRFPTQDGIPIERKDQEILISLNGQARRDGTSNTAPISASITVGSAAT